MIGCEPFICTHLPLPTSAFCSNKRIRPITTFLDEMQTSDTPFSFKVPPISRKKFEKLYTYGKLIGSGVAACVHSVTENKSGGDSDGDASDKAYALKIIAEDYSDCRSTMDEVGYGCLLGKYEGWNPVIAWAWMWETELPFDVEFSGTVDSDIEDGVEDDTESDAKDEKRYIIMLSSLLEKIDVRGEPEVIFELLYLFDQMQKWKLIHGDISSANIRYKKADPRSYSVPNASIIETDGKEDGAADSIRVTINYPYRPCFIDMASAVVYDDESPIVADQKHVTPYEPVNLDYLLEAELSSLKDLLIGIAHCREDLTTTLTKILEQPVDHWVSLFALTLPQ